jgi:hypothetical protein
VCMIKFVFKHETPSRELEAVLSLTTVTDRRDLSQNQKERNPFRYNCQHLIQKYMSCTMLG